MIKRVTKTSIILYGLVTPSLWALFYLYIFKNKLEPSSSFPEALKSLVQIISFFFSPIGAIIIAFAFRQSGNTEEIRVSNRNLYILSTLFFLFTLVFQYLNLMRDCLKGGGC